MKSGAMVSWVKRGFSSSAARLAVVLLALVAAVPAQAQTVSLIVKKDLTGTGAGVVSSTPGNISCGATCYDTFVVVSASPTIVTLSAQPAAGSIFAGWQYYSGGKPADHICNSNTSTAGNLNFGTCVVEMSLSQTFVAKFDYNPAALGLTVTTNGGSGSGTVTTDPGAMYCSPSCYESFSANTIVTLTATPAPGSKLSGWSINGVAANTPSVITNVAVNAAAKTVTLTLSSAVLAGQYISVAYADSTTANDIKAIQDATGNDAARLYATGVTNLTGGGGDTSAPVFGMATVNGSTLVMSYLDADILDSTNKPAVGAFSVLKNGASNVVTNVVVSAANKTVTLTLTTAANAGDAVSVAYADPTAGNDVFAIQDASGNDAVSLSATTVTNLTGVVDTTAPVFGMATVNGSTLVMSYLDADILDVTNIPDKSTFTLQNACNGTGPSCVITMNAAKTLSAVFDTDLNAKNLSVIKTGTGTGIVRSNPLGIYCGAFCNETYGLNTVVTLSAAPDSGSAFTGWTVPGGVCIGGALTDLSCVVKLDVSKTVKANFDFSATPTQNTLFLYKLGTGSGAVTSDPAGISCLAADCPVATNAKFASGTPVTLTATHSQGSTFSGWSGGGSAVAVSNVLINKTNKTVTLTLASPVTLGQSVTVAYTDPTSGNDGNAIQDIYGTDAVSLPASSVTNLTGVATDTTPPNFVQATVIGKTLVMSYVDAAHDLYYVDAAHVPAANAFTVQAETVAVAAVDLGTVGTPGYVPAVAINPTAKTVTLNLASAITAGQSVTVAYAVPLSNPIQDRSFNVAASLATTIATNLTGVAVGTLPPTFALASVSDNELVMSYTGPFDLNTDNPPTFGAFAVEVGGSNSCLGTATSCIVTMSKAQTVTASFDGVPPSFFTLHIGKLGAGSGLIKSTGISQDPITCGSDCDGSFTLGTPVVLKAESASDSNFSGWTGCTNSPSASEDCYVLKTRSDVSLGGTSYGVTAAFAKKLSPNNFTLTVLRAGSGTGTITSAPDGTVTPGGTVTPIINACSSPVCSSDFVSGTLVALTASALTGNTFIGWGGDCSGTDTCVVPMDKARSVTASFKAVTAVGNNTLIVLKAGSGTGIVKSDPDGIDCGTTGSCSASYPNGSLVALTATPTPGHTFFGWGGDNCSGTGPCIIRTDAAKSVSATFNTASANYTLSVINAGPGAAGTVTSDSGSISCVTGSTLGCSASYASGTLVTLTAAANPSYAFVGWSNCTPVTGNPNRCTVSMSQAQNVTASFNTPTSFLLTVSTIGNGSGTVTSNLGVISCTSGSNANCSATYASSATVTLTATPSSLSSAFVSWSGCTSASGTQCTVTMNTVQNVTANFSLTTTTSHALAVASLGNGTGTVTSLPSGISCGSSCNATFASGASVTLYATAATGSAFSSWGGDCSGPLPSCTVSISAAKNVTATFNTIATSGTYSLTVNKAGNGSIVSVPGGISCTGSCGTTSFSFASGAVVILTATADAGYTFVGWGGDCAGTGACFVTMSSAKNVAAIFTVNGQYTLTVLKAGSGTGIVKSDPSGIDCGATCTHAYANGTLVALTATQTPGHTFLGWGGDCSGTDTCVLSMSAAKNVTATFTAFNYALTVSKAGNGTGTVTSSPDGISTHIDCGGACSVSYISGASVTLTAAAATGNTFVSWGGNCSGSTLTCVVTMSTAKNVTANFTGNTAGTQSITANASPTAGGTVSCAPSPVNTGSRSTCTATPNLGYSFTAWTGDCLGTICSMGNITATKTVTANFTINRYAISATASPVVGGSVNCDPNPVGYDLPTTCTATPSSGYKVGVWSGCTVSLTDTTKCVLSNVKGNQSVSATFSVITNTASTILLSVSPLGSMVTTLTATVSGQNGTPTGSIIFKGDSTTLGTATLNVGSASASYFGSLGAGLHRLSANYSGDSIYNTSSVSLVYQVSSIAPIVAVSTSPNLSQIGASVPVIVSVASASNAGAISGTVEVSSDGQRCSIALPATSCTLTFANKGTKQLTARYSGDSVYSASTGTGVHFVGKRHSGITPILMLLLD